MKNFHFSLVFLLLLLSLFSEAYAEKPRDYGLEDRNLKLERDVYKGKTINLSDQQCKVAIIKCGIAAKKVKIRPIACKALRTCKKVCRGTKRKCGRVCRGEKRQCKTSCRDVKKQCKASCKSKHKKFTKAFRQCKKGCRNLKKSCKKSCRTIKTGCRRECKTIKTGCRDNCRTSFKTPNCQAARRQIATTILKTIPACVTMSSCIKNKQ